MTLSEDAGQCAVPAILTQPSTVPQVGAACPGRRQAQTRTHTFHPVRSSLAPGTSQAPGVPYSLLALGSLRRPQEGGLAGGAVFCLDAAGTSISLCPEGGVPAGLVSQTCPSTAACSDSHEQCHKNRSKDS